MNQRMIQHLQYRLPTLTVPFIADPSMLNACPFSFIMNGFGASVERSIS